MSAYCVAAAASANALHAAYHDTEYGFPVRDETVLFERLCLEIMQAGLSWDLVLRRREGMRAAFLGWDVDRLAALDAEAEARLLANPAIIRNRLKVSAVIRNARRVQAMRTSHGGFAAFLDSHHPRLEPDWVKLFKRTFVFSGPEIVREFLLSIGYLPGAHDPLCPAAARIAAMEPPWARPAQPPAGAASGPGAGANPGAGAAGGSSTSNPAVAVARG